MKESKIYTKLVTAIDGYYEPFLMSEIRGAPVLNKEGKPVGILSELESVKSIDDKFIAKYVFLIWNRYVDESLINSCKVVLDKNNNLILEENNMKINGSNLKVIHGDKVIAENQNKFVGDYIIDDKNNVIWFYISENINLPKDENFNVSYIDAIDNYGDCICNIYNCVPITFNEYIKNVKNKDKDFNKNGLFLKCKMREGYTSFEMYLIEN